MSDQVPPEDRLCVALGYARHGWVQLALLSSSSGASVTIQCSDVFPPFNALLTWLHQLLDARWPAVLTINEESRFFSLRAQGLGQGTDSVEFSAAAHDLPTALEAGDAQTPLLLHCRVSRYELVHEFARRLERWVADDYDPAEFGACGADLDDPPPQGDLRGLDLAALRARLAAVGAALP